ncbi:hypothetical protein DBR43_17645 [Pedobacter sp. KBW06]|uniref:DUF551 domain-containing protein n=1 Tax=Pedobacter sp. KBW06 TaxID=2153359 RepID=UPI000F59E139|nr:DUF551 domain-containing protein [Pedobacter sp. KBW06]RQO69878.1 hypothetical protein DBR43_17645 [Pedobacter sp. KBW06]
MKEWISTNERLPEDHEYKLITVINPELEYGYQIARFNTYLQEWELQEEENLSPCLKVSGWMDLPEMYSA